MKRIAFALLALSLGGALAFGQDTPAPQVKLSGYLGSGFQVNGNAAGVGNSLGFVANDKNNGGPVDFRLNFNLDAKDTGLQFSFWNSTGVFATTQLQYAFAYAAFADGQVITKVGMQNDDSTGSDDKGWGTFDSPNSSGGTGPAALKAASSVGGTVTTVTPPATTGTTSAGTATINNAFVSNNVPAAVLLVKPAAVPGLTVGYYLPAPGQAGSTLNDAFGESRFGFGYVTDAFKVTAAYELDSGYGTTSDTAMPQFDFGVKYMGVPNLTVRVEGQYIINSKTVGTTTAPAVGNANSFIQDVSYKIALDDTTSVVPYLFVGEYLYPNATTTFTNIEVNPQVSYNTPLAAYTLGFEYETTSASVPTGAAYTATSAWAICPNVNIPLGSQAIQLGADFGTYGADTWKLDGGNEYKVSGTTVGSDGNAAVGYDLWVDYKYSF